MQLRCLLVLTVVIISTAAMAGRCRLCSAQIMGNKSEFCSRCKFTPNAKKLQKEAKERESAEKSAKEKADQEKKPLKLKTFLGFEFLSESTAKEASKIVKLKKPFRGFSEAQLSYTALGRLYCINGKMLQLK